MSVDKIILTILILTVFTDGKEATFVNDGCKRDGITNAEVCSSIYGNSGIITTTLQQSAAPHYSNITAGTIAGSLHPYSTPGAYSIASHVPVTSYSNGALHQSAAVDAGITAAALDSYTAAALDQTNPIDSMISSSFNQQELNVISQFLGNIVGQEGLLLQHQGDNGTAGGAGGNIGNSGVNIPGGNIATGVGNIAGVNTVTNIPLNACSISNNDCYMNAPVNTAILNSTGCNVIANDVIVNTTNSLSPVATNHSQLVHQPILYTNSGYTTCNTSDISARTSTGNISVAMAAANMNPVHTTLKGHVQSSAIQPATFLDALAPANSCHVSQISSTVSTCANGFVNSPGNSFQNKTPVGQMFRNVYCGTIVHNSNTHVADSLAVPGNMLSDHHNQHSSSTANVAFSNNSSPVSDSCSSSVGAASGGALHDTCTAGYHNQLPSPSMPPTPSDDDMTTMVEFSHTATATTQLEEDVDCDEGICDNNDVEYDDEDPTMTSLDDHGRHAAVANSNGHHAITSIKRQRNIVSDSHAIKTVNSSLMHTARR